MAEYRYVYADLKTGALLGELPATNFSFTRTLNSAGSFRASLKLTDATIPGSSLAPGRTLVYVLRDEVAQFGGILWTATARVEENTLELAGEGFHSIMKYRLLGVTKTYTAAGGWTGPTIAKDLIDYTQAKTAGSLGILTSRVVADGPGRDRTYYDYERKNIAEAIEQLAAVASGFDFDYVTEYSGGLFKTYFQTSTETLGRPTDYVFEVGTNVNALQVNVDATNIATRVDAIGAGEGSTKLIQIATNTTTQETYPRMEVPVSYTDVRVASTLLDHATRRLARGTGPIVMPTLQMLPSALPTLGSYTVGDQVLALGSIGWLDLDGVFRITQQEVTVTDTGAETIRLSLAPLEVFVDA